MCLKGDKMGAGPRETTRTSFAVNFLTGAPSPSGAVAGAATGSSAIFPGLTNQEASWGASKGWIRGEERNVAEANTHDCKMVTADIHPRHKEKCH
jgi:hypothetical protein